MCMVNDINSFKHFINFGNIFMFFVTDGSSLFLGNMSPSNRVVDMEK